MNAFAKIQIITGKFHFFTMQKSIILPVGQRYMFGLIQTIIVRFYCEAPQDSIALTNACHYLPQTFSCGIASSNQTSSSYSRTIRNTTHLSSSALYTSRTMRRDGIGCHPASINSGHKCTLLGSTDPAAPACPPTASRGSPAPLP
jgi:hypothetical protein